MAVRAPLNSTVRHRLRITMGRELCAIHGRQTGPLCCSHIRAAAHGAADVAPIGATQFEVDLTDDGTVLLPHVVCSACPQSFGLVRDSRVSGAVAEQPGALP